MGDELSCSVEPLDLTGSVDDSLLADLAELCCFALDQEGMVGGWDISLVLTSDDHLTELHAKFMGVSQPTDIMTFPSDDEQGGDIVISAEQAERQRHDDGWDLLSELRFLVAHGALHLAGWYDGTVNERSAMLDRQRQIVRAFQSRRPSNNR